MRACVHSVGMLCGYMPNSSYSLVRRPFSEPERRYKVLRGSSLAGALNTEVGKVCVFSTEIAVYIGNSTGPCYYGPLSVPKILKAPTNAHTV